MSAQSMDPIGLADVDLAYTCAHAEPDYRFDRADDNYGSEIVVSGAHVPIVGSLLGDIAGAGLNALGNALDEASRERAFGAAGKNTFEFYRADRNSAGLVSTRIGDEIGCLIITVRGEHKNFASDVIVPEGFRIDSDTGLIQNADGSPVEYEKELGFRGVAPSRATPQLYLEAKLIPLRDGFFVRPIYIDYPRPLDKAPKRSLPAELHITFATPGTLDPAKEGDNVFALARIPLPPLKPGDRWWPSQLAVRSEIMKYRPLDGSAAELKEALADVAKIRTAELQLEMAQLALVSHLGFRVHNGTIAGCVTAGCSKELSDPEMGDLPFDYETELFEVIDFFSDPESPKLKGEIGKTVAQDMMLIAEREIALDEVLHSHQITSNTPVVNFEGVYRAGVYDDPSLDGDDISDEEPLDSAAVGSTTVMARIVLTRNANKFGQAIAAAIKKQADTLAASLSGAITTSPPAWTQAQSDYALAVLVVTHSQAALVRAIEGEDAEAIEAAETALLKAKADANLKAAAIDRSLPYPNL